MQKAFAYEASNLFLNYTFPNPTCGPNMDLLLITGFRPSGPPIHKVQSIMERKSVQWASVPLWGQEGSLHPPLGIWWWITYRSALPHTGHRKCKSLSITELSSKPQLIGPPSYSATCPSQAFFHAWSMEAANNIQFGQSLKTLCKEFFLVPVVIFLVISSTPLCLCAPPRDFYHNTEIPN